MSRDSGEVWERGMQRYREAGSEGGMQRRDTGRQGVREGERGREREGEEPRELGDE